MAPTPGLVLLTILGTLAYLGLAVLGWGGFIIYSFIFLTSFFLSI